MRWIVALGLVCTLSLSACSTRSSSGDFELNFIRLKFSGDREDTFLRCPSPDFWMNTKNKNGGSHAVR